MSMMTTMTTVATVTTATTTTTTTTTITLFEHDTFLKPLDVTTLIVLFLLFPG
jgi:hypothetical protein